MKVDSADEFYTLMGELSSDMMEGIIFNGDDMIKVTVLILSGWENAADETAQESVHDCRKAAIHANLRVFYWISFEINQSS